MRRNSGKYRDRESDRDADKNRDRDRDGDRGRHSRQMYRHDFIISRVVNNETEHSVCGLKLEGKVSLWASFCFD